MQYFRSFADIRIKQQIKKQRIMQKKEFYERTYSWTDDGRFVLGQCFM